MKKYYPGNIVKGKVVGMKPYGVFIGLEDDFVGLLHISEISDGFVSDINKIFAIGEILETKILDVDYEGRKVKLSLKALKKRKRYKPKCSLSDEKINTKKEFLMLKVRMNDFVKDAKERLGINNEC